MPEGKKCSLKYVALAVNHLITNGMTQVALMNKKHLMNNEGETAQLTQIEFILKQELLLHELIINCSITFQS